MPAASMALAVIVCVPRPNVSPEWTIVLPSLKTTGSVTSTASVAVAAKVRHRARRARRLIGLIRYRRQQRRRRIHHLDGELLGARVAGRVDGACRDRVRPQAERVARMHDRGTLA